MAKIKDSDSKYKIIVFVLISLFVLLVVLAVVLSKIEFKEKVNGTVAYILNEGDLIINYVDGYEININDTNEHSYGITITNDSNDKLYYSVYFENMNIEDVTVKVIDQNKETIAEFDKNLLSKKIINLNSIEGGDTVRYSIILKSKKNTSFNCTLKVINESLINESFADLILLNNSISFPKSRVGSEVALENEGLISTVDNKGTSYYFRGNVQNNYVKISDYLFRIVRINGDGTVRIVLNNILDKQYTYNINTLDVNADINLLVNFKDSSILNDLNNWLKSNFSLYLNDFVDGDYCTENNFNYEVGGVKYSTVYERIFIDEAPDLYCSENIYVGKIGFLSVDEVIMAGASSNKPNTKYYLYNEEIDGNYFTSSSFFKNESNNFAMVNIMSNGAVGDGILINNFAYVRPVINISNNAKIRGEGTKDNPYIIVS